MVLVQFIIDTNNNNTFFVVPISGKCCITVLNIAYHATGTVHVPIQLRSDSLYFPYSPAKYITWINGPTATLNYDSGQKQDYNLNNVVLNGQIQLAVCNASNGAVPAGFEYCVVSLQIEQLNESFQIPK
jgi:hypothetical protein